MRYPRHQPCFSPLLVLAQSKPQLLSLCCFFLKKRPRNEDDNCDEDSSTKKDRQAISGGQQISGCASPPSVAGPSNVNSATAEWPSLATTEQWHQSRSV
ncbi:hypothetical protein E2C01_055769 [Portunus trituberculatus]|uniref:Uncharacterized protein n=1 Tax=Portunus trituberculatus TaxID=210409 RepID=A0A5B7GYK6_PORTR|nr:hypothetical protein [Portunus trituberculatus]